ncbi:hypothetical protein MIC448_120018 [Microbacterium sp. C448]|nr:hypothetical protein MIC448_120018 [Microbacterium sp. C448]
MLSGVEASVIWVLPAGAQLGPRRIEE